LQQRPDWHCPLWLKIADSANLIRSFSMTKKIRVEADICAPKPVPAAGMTRTAGRGQKISLERGSWTRSKKNPGKRPHKGG
jgi:NAD dependent epimerase/dehydratase family enzyme